MFETLLTTPWIAFFLIAVLVIEATVLLAIWKRSGIGLPPRQVLSFLGAGAGFAIALGFALPQTNATGVAIGLTLAFVFHLADLIFRWRDTP